MPQLTIISRDADFYRELLEEKPLADLNLIDCAKSAEHVDVDKIEILLSEPDIAVEIIARCKRLQWLQSTWAGNTPLIQHTKQDYQLTAVKGIFGAAMREYVFAYLLFFERNIEAFAHDVSLLTSTPLWQQPKVGRLNGKRLGILGAGNIASELLVVAKAFGMTVIGANRSGCSEKEYDAMYNIDSISEFADGLDYLVCLLPDTPHTRHIIDAKLIAQLPNHCVLINAGRGTAIDDNALISALNSQQLKAAVLDVFKQEPLPNDHPYWQMENVYVTQHTAAISDPRAVIDVFADNYTRWCNQQPLLFQVDFTRGY